MSDQISQLDALLENQRAEQEKFEKAQRRREEQIAELQTALKNDTLINFKRDCEKLNITTQDIANFFEIKIVKENEPNKSKKTTKPKKQNEPRDVILQIEHEGVLKQLRGTSMKALEKEPWRSFIIDGTINKYATTHKLGEGWEAKYWTQKMIDEGAVVPTGAEEIERKNGGPIKDLEAKRKYIEEAK